MGQNRGTIGVQRETSQGKRVDPRNKEEELHSRWWCCCWVRGLPLFDHCTAAGEESNTRCYHWGFPCFFSQPQTFPAHVGWAEGSHTPLSFTEIHFPTEVQLCKPVSIGFICKREGANDWAVTPACRVKSLPSQSSQPQLLQRHHTLCKSWAERGTLCQRLTARGQPSQGGMVVHLLSLMPRCIF